MTGSSPARLSDAAAPRAGASATGGPAAPIGVFDSGVGGLSVLRHLRAFLPQEDFLYFADTAHAPYGEKAESLIIARTLSIAEFLLARGVKALVVACNTATAASIEALRSAYPALPVVGVEPGLKPAASASNSKVVGVLATGGTLASVKFRRLQQQLEADSGARFLLQACNGLASQIELGELDSPATLEMLHRYVDPLMTQGADTLVLGCTHYPFVLPALAGITPAGTRIVDTGAAVAQQMGRLLSQAALNQPGAGGRLSVFASGSPESIERACAMLLGETLRVEQAAA